MASFSSAAKNQMLTPREPEETEIPTEEKKEEPNKTFEIIKPKIEASKFKKKDSKLAEEIREIQKHFHGEESTKRKKSLLKDVFKFK